jgi:hypothetical protein
LLLSNRVLVQNPIWQVMARLQAGAIAFSEDLNEVLVLANGDNDRLDGRPSLRASELVWTRPVENYPVEILSRGKNENSL